MATTTDEDVIKAQTVRMPCSLLRRLKHYCVDRDMRQNDAMVAAIEEYLNRRGAGGDKQA